MQKRKILPGGYLPWRYHRPADPEPVCVCEEQPPNYEDPSGYYTFDPTQVMVDYWEMKLEQAQDVWEELGRDFFIRQMM